MADTTQSPVLPKEIEEHVESYLTAFNAGDADAVNRHYTPEAVAVWEPGNPISGAARENFAKEFLATQKPVMRAAVRESYVTGDTALLVVDWTMEVTGEGGAKEELQGVGLDVLRRQDDGSWLYAVDDPFGEQVRPAA
ncbi:nuclear transport factor 2 family protein [Streptomyces sp. NPDC005805]|uniref:YybH family protein n=1 Tax=Streptomyces sp. NPDC005805 TaxID=3157068 RepID=UPI003410C537